MTAPAPVEITDREIRLIIAALPDGCDPRRLELLPHLLREWARRDVPEHCQDEITDAKKRAKQIAKVGKAADDLVQTLGGLDIGAQIELLWRIGAVDGLTCATAQEGKECIQRKLDELRKIAAILLAAADKPLSKRGRGQPRNKQSLLILRDLAAIYEYMTALPATRQVNRETGEESGPFHDFVAAVWPVIFGVGDANLPAAIKSWAWACRQFPDEASAVIANMDLRHPEWGIFDADLTPSPPLGHHNGCRFRPAKAQRLPCKKSKIDKNVSSSARELHE